MRPTIVGLAVVASMLGSASLPRAAEPSGPSLEAPFLTENQVAMDRMMAGMDVRPSGNVDHDFTAMMIAHHQGAIDMAQAELRHGHNEQLRRIAQEIVVEQQQEITAMRLAIGQSPSPSEAAPTCPGQDPMPGCPSAAGAK